MSYFVDLPAQANPPCHGGLPLCHFYQVFHNHQDALVICKLGQAQKVSKMWLSILIDLIFYFSMVKIPLGLVTIRWVTVSSRLNT